MNITKENDEIVVRIPLKQKIYNPYCAEDADIGYTDNLYGVIAGYEYTISQLIDLDYKSSQQEGRAILHLDSEKHLREICEEFNIQLIVHQMCDYCHRPIYG